MRAIFSRPLTSRRHEPMDEWKASLERLTQVCPNRQRGRHPVECWQCEETVREVLLASMRDDTAPLPLLDAVNDQLERTLTA